MYDLWHWTIVPWEMCLAWHLGCPRHYSLTPVNTAHQGVHHTHIQQVQGVVFVQRRVNAMPVCLPVAAVTFALFVDRGKLVFYSIHVVGHPLFLC